MVKNPPAIKEMQETRVQFLGEKDPWRRKWQPTPVFLLGKYHGQRNQAVYSPWGHKESDTTRAWTQLVKQPRSFLLSHMKPQAVMAALL